LRSKTLFLKDNSCVHNFIFSYFHIIII